jgi:hypothetical protein
MFIKKNMHLFSHQVRDHSYSTRNKNCFKVTKHKSTNFSKKVYITGRKFYNKLFSELMNESKFGVFNGKIIFFYNKQG